MVYGLSNGDVTDDVTWPWKVKLVWGAQIPENERLLWGSTVGYPRDS